MPNKSMDVRAKQRLSYCGFSFTQTVSVAVSPHVISIVHRFLKENQITVKTTNGFALRRKKHSVVATLAKDEVALNKSMDARAKQRLCYLACSFNSELCASGFAPRHLNRSTASVKINVIMAKHFLILICLLLFAVDGFSQSQNKADASNKSTLEKLTKITSEIYDAGISRNRSVIEKYFAETYLETDALGVLRDKAWNLTNLLPTNEKITYRIEDAQVREYDEVAVLYYKWVVRYEITTPAEVAGTKDAVTITNAQLQVTDTFIKSRKGWQIISSSRVRLRNEPTVNE